MPIICENIIKEITSEVLKIIINDNRVIVWYGGRKLLSILNDCVNIMGKGKKISYVIIDETDKEGYFLDYAWNIPLINKNINVDIKKSTILSEYHINNNQPMPVGYEIVDLLKNEAKYFLCSNRSQKLKEILKDKGISNDCICEITPEDVCLRKCRKQIEDKLSGMIPLELDEIQNIELDILKEFRNFCIRHNLRYWLAGGTLLGAVRHRGFIPWDDDIDVFMPDVDYQKFIELYRDNDKYELLSNERNTEYPFFFSKLTNRRTVLWHYGYPMNYLMGMYIDIFPLVGYPNDIEAQKKQWELEHITMAEWYWYQDIAGILGGENIPLQRDKILSNMKLPKFDFSPWIGQVSVILQKQWLSKRTDFVKTVTCEFEGELFQAPAGYDRHLKKRYGDYMTLPPLEKRTVHGFPMYKL